MFFFGGAFFVFVRFVGALFRIGSLFFGSVAGAVFHAFVRDVFAFFRIDVGRGFFDDFAFDLAFVDVFRLFFYDFAFVLFVVDLFDILFDDAFFTSFTFGAGFFQGFGIKREFQRLVVLYETVPKSEDVRFFN